MSAFLHSMIRVYDLDRSITFYQILGMQERRRREVAEGRYTLVYMAFSEGAEVELTYNWDRLEPYQIGDGFGHLAIGVSDIRKVVELVRDSGGKVTREPGPVKFGKTVIAFVEDPDGYKIEIVEQP